MSDQDRDDIELGKLSDRELLLLTAKRVNGHNKWMVTIDSKVRALEDWRTWLSGAVAVLGAGIGYVLRKHG